MTTSIQDVYGQYLKREIPLDQVRDWLALNQWDLSGPDRDLADEADVALVHLDDGYSNEESLRVRLSLVLEQYSSQTVWTTYNLVRSRASVMVRSDQRFAVTGTAAQNAVSEMAA